MHGVRVPFGVGIYQRAEAARLLRMTPTRLRRWVNGYTYWLHSHVTPRQRRQPLVVTTDLPMINGAFALSFLELMELRVVKALVDKGVPLQRVRAAGRFIAEAYKTSHPFAAHRLFTDGRDVFTSAMNEAKEDVPDLVQWSRGKHWQMLFGAVLEPFLDEIDFDKDTALAARWWPWGRSFPIVLDPRVLFGAPAIEGTRLRTDVIAGMVKVNSPNEVREAFRISGHQVGAAVEFESQLAAAA